MAALVTFVVNNAKRVNPFLFFFFFAFNFPVWSILVAVLLLPHCRITVSFYIICICVYPRSFGNGRFLFDVFKRSLASVVHFHIFFCISPIPSPFNLFYPAISSDHLYCWVLAPLPLPLLHGPYHSLTSPGIPKKTNVSKGSKTTSSNKRDTIFVILCLSVLIQSDLFVALSIYIWVYDCFSYLLNNIPPSTKLNSK